MIKVCHMTTIHPRYDGRILQRQCISLAEHGYDVTLVVNDEMDDEIYHGVHIVSTGYKVQSKLGRIAHSIKVLLQMAIKTDADIYCVHDPELLCCVKALKRRNKKIIFDSHEFYALRIMERRCFPYPIRKGAACLYQCLEKYFLKYVDAVLAPCTLDGKNYFEGRAKKTVLISNVPRLRDFYDQYEEADHVKKGICYVGSLSYERGVYHIIKAMGVIKGRLILVGNYISPKFENSLKQLPEFRYVDEKGYLSKSDLTQIYKECGIGICNLLHVGQYDVIDTLATKIYEYLSMGMAVVMTDNPYARQILKRYPFGICVEPDNINELSEAVRSLIINPALRKKMGEEGRRAIRECFNWEREQEKLIHLYYELSH